MTLDEAETLAEAIAATLRPYCYRLTIAGSIRRRKGTVHDIDIVVVPMQYVMLDLFGGPDERVCHLHLFAKNGIKKDDDRQTDAVGFDLIWTKPNSEDHTPHRVLPLGSGKDGLEGRRWTGWERVHKVKVELYLTDPERFGATLLIRTGSGEFSQAVVTHARRVGMRFETGELIGRDGKPVAVPEESDVFRALGLAPVDPMDRHDHNQVRGKVWK